VGPWASLALDSTGSPHISYHDNDNNTLKYAWLSRTVWLSTTVDNSGPTGLFTSLALDSNDVPHIGYGYSNSSLKYAWLSSTVWHIAEVSTGGSHASLAPDGADNPYISYHRSSGSDLMIAWMNGTAWVNEPVDIAGTVGLYTSLALDSLGDPHISYHAGEGSDNLKYAWGSRSRVYLSLVRR
jgi:hypothetical protein